MSTHTDYAPNEDDTPTFRLTIVEGNSIKLLLELLEYYLCSTISVNLNSAGLSIMENNDAKNCSIHVNIDKTKTDGYICETPRTIMFTNTMIVKTFKSSVRSSDRITLAIHRENPDILCFYIYEKEADRYHSRMDIPITDSRPQKIGSIEYTRHITMDCGFFKSRCKGMVKVSDKVEIVADSPGQIKFISRGATLSDVKIYRGVTVKYTKEEKAAWKTYSSTFPVTHISKIALLCYNNKRNIKWNIPDDSEDALSIRLPLGDVGEMIIYLRQKSESND